ncbi:MAG: hypothetical protein RTU30_04315 [Candidatus Thorarchaeota archaeon]
MAKFRADHYLVAEFENPDIRTDGDRVLEALKELPELKDLAIVTRKLEGKQWREILGRIDIPAGSKAFWAMVKTEITDREPYNLFIRIDVNAEGETIDDARAKIKTWVESEFVPRIESKVTVKSIKVLQPQQVFMPELS